MPRTLLLALKAVGRAIADAYLMYGPRKIGIVVGTTNGGMDKTEMLYQTSVLPSSYLHSHHCGFITDYLASFYNLKDYGSTISTACSSGANAIMTGARLLKSGKLDVVIAGGTDALSNYTINGFNSLMILDNQPSKPFSKERNGLNLGEGAGFVVMERQDYAVKRGAPIYGYLSGYANTNDAFHQTKSSPDGRGAVSAMKQAIELAGIKPVDIDYINVHGTGTDNNDLIESIAIEKLFGNKVPDHSSTKGFTGHCLGAAGAIEAVISLLALEHNQLYPNLRFGSPVLDNGPLPILKTTSKQVNHVLSNSFGFGGCDTSLVFSKESK